MRRMDITIKATPKEIADLILEVQSQPNALEGMNKNHDILSLDEEFCEIIENCLGEKVIKLK